MRVHLSPLACLASGLPLRMFVGAVLSLGILLGGSGLGRVQAEEPLTVYINRVGEVVQDNPQVDLNVTVLAPNGLPLQDTISVQVAETGQIIAAPQIVPALDLPLRLVLALDLSYDSEADWRNAVAAAQSLITSLRSDDRLTIVRFGNTVNPDLREIDLSQPPELIKDSAFGLEGNRTAFYQVTQHARSLLDPTEMAWRGRQGVVLLTNIGDNTQSKEAEEAKAQLAQQAGPDVPVYILSFTGKAEQTKLQEVADWTKGQFRHVNVGANLSEEMVKLVEALRPGYRVSFVPLIGAEVDHPVTLMVTDALGRQGSDTAQYRYLPRQAWLSLPEVNDLYLGQSLVLTAQVQMPFPVNRIEYRLNEHIQIQRDPPYLFIWSANQVGSYHLSVSAVDEQGNRADPVERTFQVYPWPDGAQDVTVFLGEPVRLNVQTEIPGAMAEFYMDSTLIKKVDSAPYDFDLLANNPGYPTVQGVKLIKVTISRDGRVLTQRVFRITFKDPAEPPSWWKVMWPVLSSGVMLALVSLLLLPMLLAIWHDQYWADLIRRRKVCNFDLHNLSNVPAGFKLRAVAVEPPDALEFCFSQLSPPTTQANVGTVFFSGDTATSPMSSPKATQQPATPSMASKVDGGWWSSQTQVPTQLAQVGGASVGVISEVTSLPILGRWMQPLGSALRFWQRQGRSMLRWTTYLGQGWGRLGQRLRPAGDLFKAESSNLIEQEPAKEAEHPVAEVPSPAANLAGGRVEHRPALEADWQAAPTFETELIAPGQKIRLSLGVRRANWLYKTEEFRFEISSKPAVADFTEFRSPQEQIYSQLLTLPQGHWLYRHGLSLMPLLVLFVVTVDLLWLVIVLGIFMA